MAVWLFLSIVVEGGGGVGDVQGGDQVDRALDHALRPPIGAL